MSDLRTAAQQALEALEWHYRQGHSNTIGGFRLKIDEKALRELRAALAQQDEPTDPGNDVDVLREHVRHLERRVRQLHAQQAEPVAGVVLNEEGRAALVEHGREEWHCVSRNARRLYIAPPQRKSLTEKEMYIVEEEARKNFRLSQKGPRGQQITYWDGLTPWLIRAVELAHGIKE